MSKPKNAESIEAKIAQLQNELKEAKKAERHATREAERRERERRKHELLAVAERTGLLAAYGDTAALERAFTALAGRMNSGISIETHHQDSADDRSAAFRTSE